MNKHFVPDNSVAIKLVKKENLTEKSRKLFQNASNFEISLFAPEIFIYEFFNICTPLVGTHEAEYIFREITKWQFSILPLDDYGRYYAHKICKSHKSITFYDASYHGLAFQTNSTLITNDINYYKKAKKFGRIELLSNY